MLAKCVLQLKTKSLYHSGGKISFSTILINVQMCFLNYKVSSSLWRDKTCRDFFFLLSPHSAFCLNYFEFILLIWEVQILKQILDAWSQLFEPLDLEIWHKLCATWDSHCTFDFGQSSMFLTLSSWEFHRSVKFMVCEVLGSFLSLLPKYHKDKAEFEDRAFSDVPLQYLTGILTRNYVRV